MQHAAIASPWLPPCGIRSARSHSLHGYIAHIHAHIRQIGGPLKLITWNVQWCRGLDGRVDPARIVAHARSMADFDVLCVQEVADNFPALERNDDRDQFAELASLLRGYEMAAGFGVDVAGEGGRRRRFGNAIFTRYSLLAVRRHALPWPADEGKESMPRVAVETTLQAAFG